MQSGWFFNSSVNILFIVLTAFLCLIITASALSFTKHKTAASVIFLISSVLPTPLLIVLLAACAMMFDSPSEAFEMTFAIISVAVFIVILLIAMYPEAIAASLVMTIIMNVKRKKKAAVWASLIPLFWLLLIITAVGLFVLATFCIGKL